MPDPYFRELFVDSTRDLVTMLFRMQDDSKYQRHPSERVRAFLAAGPFAVVGASTDRAKFGNRVLRKYIEHGLAVTPVNPRGGVIEGLAAATSLTELVDGGAQPGAVSIITPPAVTEGVVREALELGIEHLWLQPGAESERAVQWAEEGGASLLWGGPCLLVEL